MKCKRRIDIEKFIFFINLVLLLYCLFSCKTVPTISEQEINLSREILGKGQLSAVQLADFFITNNEHVEKEFILKFADYYIQEASMENINSDVAFA